MEHSNNGYIGAYKEIREKIVEYSRLMYNDRLVSATSGNIAYDCLTAVTPLP